jgi:hypothetical protein
VLGPQLERLRGSYRKTVPDLLALLLGRHPRFVTAADPGELGEEIPVFTFHSVEPERFAAQLRFLAENGYRTLGGEGLRQALGGDEPAPPRSVVLTFDDGLATLRTVAEPLLAEHGFRALAFVIAGCVPDTAPATATLADVTSGRAPGEAVLAREAGPSPLCSWEELRALHEAGSIEIHSHSLHHDLVPVSDQLVDFVHPGFTASFANTKLPSSHADAAPRFERDLVLGTPVYRCAPRLSGRPQFFDDESVRRACQQYVAQRGGERFFDGPGWRRELLGVHRAALREGVAGRLARADEAAAAIEEDLGRSREEIRRRLPGAAADHLCFPWYAGSALAVGIARRVGYRAAHWGIVPGRRTNRPGDDPFGIARVDERYLLRLPGRGRRPLRAILEEQLTRRSRHGAY